MIDFGVMTLGCTTTLFDFSYMLIEFLKLNLDLELDLELELDLDLNQINLELSLNPMKGY